MLSGPALIAALAHLPTRPRRGTFFRASATQHVTDPLGRKRPIGRNRFNIADGARVLYCAEDMFTCLHELQAFAWPAQATSIVPIEFKLNSVLDLIDARVQAMLQTNTPEISFNFRSVPLSAPPTATQQLGEVLAASGHVDGILWHSCALPAGEAPKLDLAIIEAGVIALGSSVEANDPLNRVKHTLP